MTLWIKSCYIVTKSLEPLRQKGLRCNKNVTGISRLLQKSLEPLQSLGFWFLASFKSCYTPSEKGEDDVLSLNSIRVLRS